ncbi:MAG: hypothetical protein OEZ06_21385 [Myxococcales bacterium]|nr:hypothetical protein [Myxococcales bacterium]
MNIAYFTETLQSAGVGAPRKRSDSGIFCRRGPARTERTAERLLMLLDELERERQSGVLSYTSADGVRRYDVVVADGGVSYVSGRPGEADLDELMAEAGQRFAPIRRALQRARRRGLPLAQALGELAPEGVEALQRTLRRHVARGLWAMAGDEVYLQGPIRPLPGSVDPRMRHDPAAILEQLLCEIPEQRADRASELFRRSAADCELALLLCRGASGEALLPLSQHGKRPLRIVELNATLRCLKPLVHQSDLRAAGDQPELLFLRVRGALWTVAVAERHVAVFNSRDPYLRNRIISRFMAASGGNPA